LSDSSADCLEISSLIAIKVVSLADKITGCDFTWLDSSRTILLFPTFALCVFLRFLFFCSFLYKEFVNLRSSCNFGLWNSKSIRYLDNESERRFDSVVIFASELYFGILEWERGLDSELLCFDSVLICFESDKCLGLELECCLASELCFSRLCFGSVLCLFGLSSLSIDINFFSFLSFVFHFLGQIYYYVVFE